MYVSIRAPDRRTQKLILKVSKEVHFLPFLIRTANWARTHPEKQLYSNKFYIIPSHKKFGGCVVRLEQVLTPKRRHYSSHQFFL
jgi:hypothetical protein